MMNIGAAAGNEVVQLYLVSLGHADVIVTDGEWHGHAWTLI